MILEFQRNNNIKYINKKKEEVYIYREREREMKPDDFRL